MGCLLDVLEQRSKARYRMLSLVVAVVHDLNLAAMLADRLIFIAGTDGADGIWRLLWPARPGRGDDVAFAPA